MSKAVLISKFFKQSRTFITPLIQRNINRFPQFQHYSTCSNTKTLFGEIKEAPLDPILGISVAYKADTNPKKVDLGVGAYRTDSGTPFVLSCIKEAEKRIANMNHEYLPQQGDQVFRQETQKVIFGDNSSAIKDGRICTLQSLSGTGALKLGVSFISKFLPKGTTMYFPNPTWGNHFNICKHAGVPTGEYRYWDGKNKKIDIDGFLEDLNNKIAPGSVVLLHSCAHNPTGMDFSQKEWKLVCEAMKDRELVPFFDCAYQGFASGDLNQDAWAIRYFTDQGMEVIAAQSFAKNFGLYGERIGAIHFVCKDKKTSNNLLSQMNIIVRAIYSNPPLYGARLVSTVLSDQKLYGQWKKELVEMSQRIIKMRKALRGALERLGTPGDWSHITKQIGMFSYTGLNAKQVDVLIKKYHIYMLANGRISLAGLNSKNVEYVAKAFHDVVTSIQ